MSLLTISTITKELKLSPKDWKGKCHEIASAIVRLKMAKGRAVYGHWLGPISKKSFFSHRIGMPFIRHGWILAFNRKIIDPTRWVFEAVTPYVYSGIDKEGYYDEGGQVLRALFLRPPPKPKKKEKKLPCVLKDETKEYISDLLGTKIKDTIDFGQLFWIANLPPKNLGIYIEEVYQWLKNIEQKVLVPLDNWLMIMESG